MSELNEKIRQQLMEWAETDFDTFSAGLIPGEKHVLGVRLPLLRSYAKELAKGDWQTYLLQASDDSMEETMLQGMTLGYVKSDFAGIRPYLDAFLPKIKNWSVCDSTCASLKIARKEPEAVLEYLLPYLRSDEEFFIRFGVVMLLDHFITEDYIDLVLEEVDKIHQEAYYVKMAVAWNLSVCFVKFRDKTLSYLRTNHLDDWTYNKTIQKIRESYRVTKEDKKMLLKMKRKAEK